MRSRRDFFRQMALLAGSGGLTDGLLAAVQKASAIDPAKGSSYLDAEHVVILMQENRSFDHAFGTLRGVRGFNDPRAITLPNQNPVWLQSNDAGETYAPFHLDIKETNATWLGSLPHSWRDQTDARAEGNHDGWLEAKRSGHKDCHAMPLTMGYYDRSDIPFYYALADAFTICDQHFCSSLTGTTPNRLYLWSGTIRERQDPSTVANVWNSDIDYGSSARWTTFPERLESAGVSWRIYQNELSVPTGLSDDQDGWLANFTDNPIEWFDQFNVGLLDTHRAEVKRMAVKLPAEIHELDEKLKAATPGSESHRRLTHEVAERRRWMEYVKTAQEKWGDRTKDALLSPRERALHEKAFTTNTGDPDYRELTPLRYEENGVAREMVIPKGDVLHQFRQDVAQGKLPSVSWIVAPEKFSDHPGAPWYGAWYLAEVLNILTQNPEVWKKTIFILTYDENDGYFDHVPPFVAPNPTDPESGKTSASIHAEAEYVPLEQQVERKGKKDARGGPIGLGFRVPLVIASPWSRGGYVCSQVFDHTSVIQFVETWASKKSGKAVRETNISEWRRAVCGDLTSSFRPFDPQGGRSLPYPEKTEFLEGIHKAQFKQLPSGFHRVSSEDATAFKKDRFGVTWMPQQEKGTRPSSALPYQLYAGGVLSADRQGLEITLEARNQTFGKRAAGSAFHAYAAEGFGKARSKRSRAYAVAAGERVSDTWKLDGFQNGVYRVSIVGPNGFLREFSGTSKDPKVHVHAEYRRSIDGSLSGDLELQLANQDAASAYTFIVRDLSYGAEARAWTVAAGASRVALLELGHSACWYDFSVEIEGVSLYQRRFAGRVETGRDGISDPVMGRVWNS